jgi:glycosyltransferase involved in cell wall biosynthesis
MEIYRTINPDVVWLGHGQISYPLLRQLKGENAQIKVVVDTDSVWSRYIIRQLPFVNNHRRRQEIIRAAQEKLEEERWGTALADITTAVSEVDAHYYRQLDGAAGKVCLLSNVVDVKEYEPVPSAPIGFRRPALCLTGTFWSGSPMEDAARWVIGKVLPLVKRMVPQVHLYIIGRGSDRVLIDVQDPAVTVTGRVMSVLPFLSHCEASLVPLRFESGTRFKILEAGVCRVPVVSTSLGAEGLPVKHGENILLADNAEDFSKAIVQVISDKDIAERLGRNLGHLVVSQFSIEELSRQVSSVLDRLVAQSSEFH